MCLLVIGRKRVHCFGPRASRRGVGKCYNQLRQLWNGLGLAALLLARWLQQSSSFRCGTARSINSQSRSVGVSDLNLYLRSPGLKPRFYRRNKHRSCASAAQGGDKDVTHCTHLARSRRGSCKSEVAAKVGFARQPVLQRSELGMCVENPAQANRCGSGRWCGYRHG
jgi:hypothetical protein